MALNEKRLVEIMIRRCQEMDKRCKNYREKLLECVVHVLEAERDHRRYGGQVAGTVSRACAGLGEYLADRAES